MEYISFKTIHSTSHPLPLPYSNPFPSFFLTLLNPPLCNFLVNYFKHENCQILNQNNFSVLSFQYQDLSKLCLLVLHTLNYTKEFSSSKKEARYFFEVFKFRNEKKDFCWLIQKKFSKNPKYFCKFLLISIKLFQSKFFLAIPFETYKCAYFEV